jgi:hypothetical protein
MHPVAEQNATSRKLAKGWFAGGKGGDRWRRIRLKMVPSNRDQSTCDNASLAAAVMLHLR